MLQSTWRARDWRKTCRSSASVDANRELISLWFVSIYIPLSSSWKIIITMKFAQILAIILCYIAKIPCLKDTAYWPCDVPGDWKVIFRYELRNLMWYQQRTTAKKLTNDKCNMKSFVIVIQLYNECVFFVANSVFLSFFFSRKATSKTRLIRTF